MTNATKAAADAEEGFDPHAPYLAPNGLRYSRFVDYFVGAEPLADDRANDCIKRYLAQGRSEAFCRVFREGYDGHLARIGGPGAPDREVIAACHAEDAATWREREAARLSLEAQQASQGRRRGVKDGLFPAGVVATTDHNHRVGLGLYQAYQATEHAEAHSAGFARATAEHGDQHES